MTTRQTDACTDLGRWMCQQSDYEMIQIWNTCASSQHGELQRFIKMNTHTHTKKVESSGRQNGHRHLTLYFILVSVLQDAKYIIIMLYSQWRPIHQSVNWCGWLYTRPGFIEKWSMAWEQKQMKCVCGLGSSFRSPTGLLMGAQNNKDNILPKKNSPCSHYLPWF